jgi:sugar lactone lactonase YvrE
MSSSPVGMALDHAGNVVVADYDNHRVVRIDPSTGSMAVIAGLGMAGFMGDGGPATQAALSGPTAVAVDAAGNILISDSGNNRIRMVDAQTGIIATIAGTGAPASGGDGGPAISAGLYIPIGLAFDAAGNLFIGEERGGRVRRISAADGKITTIAGNGTMAFTPDFAPAASSSLNAPGFVGFDNSGNLLIAEMGAQRLRLVDSNGLLHTVAGNGNATYSGDGAPATSIAIGIPGKFAVDAAGNIFIAGVTIGRVLRLDSTTGTISTFAGNGMTGPSTSGGDGGLATTASIPSVSSVVFLPGGDMLVADGWAYSVRRISLPSPYAYTMTNIDAPTSGIRGQTITLTATVASVSTVIGPGAPSGGVQFWDYYQTPLGTAPIIDGKATLQVMTPNPGLSITAFYMGDATHSTSMSAVVSIPMKISSTVALMSAPNPSNLQQAVTITASVNPPGTYPQPTGTVQFLDGGSVIGSGSVINGSAQLTVPFTTGGVHPLTATYSGDATFGGSTSSVLNQTVNGGLTVTLSSSAPSSTYGQTFQFTATVSPAGASGTVQFLDGSVSLGSAVVTGGLAILTAPVLNAGSHTITASYSGDAMFPPATSAPFIQTVAQATPTFIVTSSLNPSTAGQPVTFVVTVTPVSSGGGLGLNISNPPSSLQATWSAGRTSITTPDLSPGTHIVTASWSGDANVAAATSSPLSQLVKAQASGNATSSANPVTVGSSVTFTVTVSPATASGAVDFWDYGTSTTSHITLATVPLVNGTASFTTSTLTAGTHNIAVNYTGDANTAAYTSPLLAQVVNQIGTAVALISAENPTYPQHPVVFTATVSPAGGASTQPGGTLQILDGGTVLATGTLQNGVVQASLAFAFGSHALTAVYSGDATFQGSTSAVVNQVVKNAVGVNLSSSGFVPVGSPVTLTATVAPSDATGTVAIWDYGTSTTYVILATLPVSSGTASFTTSSLTPGTHNMVAHYSGDANYLSTNSTVLGQLVSQTAANVAIASSENPTAPQHPIVITTSITASNNFSTPASGTVQLLDGTATIATATLQNGAAQFSVSFSSPGAHSLTVSYGGDTNYLANTSGTLAQTVNPIVTTITTASSPNPSTFGQTVTFTAAVSPAAATGTVRFLDGATTIGAVALNGGSAALATAALAVGSHAITAVYSGDAMYAGSTSAPLAQVVNKAASAVAIGSTANPSTFGQGVTFTASVTPGGATGTVQFLDGSTILGTAGVSGGAASIATAALGGGNHSITAVYSGDGSYAGSTSAALSQIVNRAPSTTAIASSANPVSTGMAVTFTATVAHGAVTGTVQFLDGATVLGTAALNSGTAALTTSSLAAGSHTISAVYSGDLNFAGSSASLSQSVWNPTSTSLTSDKTSTIYGQIINFTATVSPSTATGTVTFMDGSVLLGVVPLSAGQARLSIATLGAGTHNVTASYGGDAADAPSPAGSRTVTVAQAQPTITLTGSPNPAAVGQIVTLTATLSAASATGTVDFKDGAAVLGTVIVANRTAVFTTSALTRGNHSITAVYSGDGNYTAAISGSLNEKMR